MAAPAFRLFITTTDLESSKLHVFGDDAGDGMDTLNGQHGFAAHASTMGVRNSRQYIDGGTITPLPLRVALERGATEIYALHLADGSQRDGSLVKGVMSVMGRSVSTMLRLQADHDLFLIEKTGKVKLHYIGLTMSNPPGDTGLHPGGSDDRIGLSNHAGVLGDESGQPTPIRLGTPVRVGPAWQPGQAHVGPPATAAPKTDEQKSGLGGADHPPTQASA